MAAPSTVRTVRARDGLRLEVEVAGPALNQPGVPAPLVCLAGLTRTRRDFWDLRDHFAQHRDRPRPVIMIDARGRGGSARAADPASYTVLQEADDVLAVCTALGIEHAVLVGTSRGGLQAMVLAIARGGMILGTVLNDIGPKISLRGLLRLKSQLGTHASEPTTWDEAEQRLRGALGHQFPAYSDEDWAHAARLTFMEKNGKPAQAYDPAILDGLSAFSSDTPPPNLTAPFRALARRPILLI
ncbi:MAG: alpha/beta hydrolase, partial [Devosiaceae bacterium]|nr:alpha/beta hydrolase [Devosiaceae bacterium MH13]